VKIIKKYVHTYQSTDNFFKIFPLLYLSFVFAYDSDIVRAIKRKPKLLKKIVHNFNFKRYKKVKTYFIHSNYQSHKHCNFLFYFNSLKNTLSSTCKTALDDICAYLSILRAITVMQCAKAMTVSPKDEKTTKRS
jgi:hypothetical protein